MFGSWQPTTEVRFLLCHRDSEIEVLSPTIFTFQKDGSKVLEKDFKWVVKVARSFLKDLYLRSRERNYKFSKVNAIRKKKERRQKEGCI